jgi:hypothetical protein
VHCKPGFDPIGRLLIVAMAMQDPKHGQGPISRPDVERIGHECPDAGIGQSKSERPITIGSVLIRSSAICENSPTIA